MKNWICLCPSVSGWTGQPQTVCLFHKGDQIVAVNDLHASSVEEYNMYISKALKSEVRLLLAHKNTFFLFVCMHAVRLRGSSVLRWSWPSCVYLDVSLCTRQTATAPTDCAPAAALRVFEWFVPCDAYVRQYFPTKYPLPIDLSVSLSVSLWNQTCSL